MVELVEDARVLWNRGRRSGALLLALVAVAARARTTFPHSSGLTDRQAFERYLQECGPWRVSVEFRGELHPVEHVFYKWMRCYLVHEGELPPDIQFLDNADGLIVRAGGAPGYTLGISPDWFEYLVACAVTA